MKIVLNEIWKDIPNHPRYQVSTFGRVRKLHKDPRVAPFKILKQRIIRGYLYASIPKGIRAHRLVLLVFRGPCPEGYEGMHRDGNRFNNKLMNLKWGTKSENAKDKTKHGTQNPPPVMTDEIRAKISLACKGNKKWLGRKHTEESKAKMRNSMTEERLERLRQPKSEEHKRKVSEAQTARWQRLREESGRMK